MTNGDKVRIAVRSHRVPVGVIEFQKPIEVQSGFSYSSTERRVVYESIFDDSQLQAIEEARRLSRDLGLQLEIVDMASTNPLRSMISRITSLGRSTPSLVLTKSWPTRD